MKKILIANRGEIASRIQHTCEKLNIKTVCIYCPQDKFASFVFDADESYPLSQNGAAAYLNQDEIIKIAKKAKVDAIIPGYGFLSENYQFTELVIKNNFIWIGPNPEIIKMMGNKTHAREIMQNINIPTIHGFSLNFSEVEKGKKLAQQIGYPILLKDPFAGGGKAMRVLYSEEKFKTTWETIKSESSKLTGSQEILLEKFIKNGRHIEVQICGDGKNFIHLFERECSIQRRHQKIIEEAPCNFVDQKILYRMYDCSLKIAKHVKYNNIGTIEFLVTEDQKFYFLEINTRLQVEHSVTEFTTGLDLVKMQIQIAKTKKLSIKQNDVSRKNHSIECRIYSEDPAQTFSPSTGTINFLKLPNLMFGRIDHNLEQETQVTPFFDPMIAKITTFGSNRFSSIKNMLVALQNLKINGVKTNIDFLQKILQSKEFKSGNIHTQLLNDKKYMNSFETPAFTTLRGAPQDERCTQKNTYTKNEVNIAKVTVGLLSKLIKNNKKEDNKIINNWGKRQWK